MDNTIYQSIENYLPHKKPMILLERVIKHSPESVTCEVSVNKAGVLAPFLDENNAIPSWFFIEMMAQTIGVWNGLRLENSGLQPKVALLLGVRKFSSEYPNAPLDSLIKIIANVSLFDDNLSSFECSLLINNKLIASANIVAYEATQAQIDKFKEEIL